MGAHAKDGSLDRTSSHVRIRAVEPRLSRAPVRVRAGESVVVVGGGIAGHALCTALEGMPPSKRPRVTLIAEEAALPYDRVRLSSAIAEPDPTALALAPASWYSGCGVSLRLGDRAIRIDREARQVLTDGGVTVRYDRLVLATGSHPVRPPVPGIDDPRCFVYRSLDDVRALSAVMDEAVTSAVLGGGLLGLEAAKVLLDRGHQVHVIEAGDRLMPRQLDGASAASLRTLVEGLGLRVQVADRVTAIERADGRLRLRLLSGLVIAVDLVVVAAGIRPRDDLAEAAGLDCDPRGGVVVDDFLRTSDPLIHAIGECARHRGSTYGLAAPCKEMARALGQTLFSQPTRFERADPSCRLKVVGIDVAAMGEYDGQHQRIASRTEAGSRALLVRDGRLVGAVSVGAWPERGEVDFAVARRAKITREDLAAFERTGALWPSRRPARPSSWPRATVICACTGVTVDDLLRHRERGVRTIEAAARSTGASTGCGSCEHLVRLLVSRSHAAPPPRPAWGLMALSALTLGVGLALALGLPLRAATAAHAGWRTVDWFWSRHALEQVTGFVAAGVVVPGFLLSLKKRLKRPAAGGLPVYRALHAALGLLALGALAAHTGLRVGANLNRALMVSFVAASALGAVAGVFTSLEARRVEAPAGAARRLREGATLAHLLFLWPLPVLLAIHVLASFYF